MDAFLRATDIIDWQHSEVSALARQLASDSPMSTAKVCFEWVRDNIKHSYDYHLNPSLAALLMYSAQGRASAMPRAICSPPYSAPIMSPLA